MADELVTLHEAAVRLGCSIRHVCRLIEAGRLRSVRRADDVERVVEASLVAYANERQALDIRGATQPGGSESRSARPR
jgi:hypothetical protein